MAPALRDVAADVSAGRALAVQHRIARAERSGRPRVAAAAGGLLQDAHLRAVGYEGDRLLDAGGTDRPAAEPIHDQFPDRQDGGADAVRPERVGQAAGVSVRSGGPGFDGGRLSPVRASPPQRGRSQEPTSSVPGIGAFFDDETSDAPAKGGGGAAALGGGGGG